MLKERLEERAEGLNKLLEGRLVLTYTHKTINSGTLEGYMLDPGNQNAIPVLYHDESWDKMSDMELAAYFLKFYEDTKIEIEPSTIFNADYIRHHVLPMLMDLKHKDAIDHDGFLYLERDGFLVVFYCPVKPEALTLEPGAILTFRIYNSSLEHLGIAPEKIIEAAYKNLDGLVKLDTQCLPGMEPVTLVTTSYRAYGSAAIMSSRARKRLKKLHGDRFFVLPISMNEVMVTSRIGDDFKPFFKDLMSMNVPDSEKLTDNIYVFENDILHIEE